MDLLYICYNTVTCWITDNYEWLYIIITTMLTILLIHQNGKLSKQQQAYQEKSNQQQQEFQQKLTQQQLDFQQKIHERDVEMQKRQLKVDTYPYKREIYCHVFAVLELCHNLQVINQDDLLYSKHPDDINQIWKTLQENYIPDTKAALWSMREAEYVLPPEIAKNIIIIREKFDIMGAHFTTMSTISNILLKYDMKTETMKKDKLDSALKLCNEILHYRAIIESALPKELDIGTINQ